MDVDEFLSHYDSVPLDNVLTHYASPYYDPVKAREYYLRTRELKGRRSTKGMSETQQQAWSYAKNQISENKKAELRNTAEEQKVRLENLRVKAEETRDRIQEKLNSLLETLRVGPVERVTPREVPVPDLIPVPSNASAKVLAYIQRQNGRRLNKYAGEVANAEAEAREKQQVINEEARQKRIANSKIAEEAKAKSREERVRVGNELKDAVNAARAAYEEAKKAVVAKYEAATDSEYNNIKTQLPGAAPKAAKARKPKTTKDGKAATSSKKSGSAKKTKKSDDSAKSAVPTLEEQRERLKIWKESSRK
jgi:hypothetical protein